jgi:hypothetical protein
MKHHSVVTVRELELEHKHMGITWIAIEMKEESRRSRPLRTGQWATRRWL